MPLQFLEVGFHVEIHAIEWHDFERDTQFHGVVVARIEFSLKETEKQQLKGARIFSEPIARAAVSGLISAA